MRPIRLKIKGLNSFIEEQVIDFEKLTEKGLFGIFGPTGSGKSTVLDGITLALYGEVSRKSSNFINTNCNSMSVSYEFQINDAKRKKYKVEREFKRDKKSGNPVSGKCRLIDLDTNEIIADKVKEINNTCKEIIGLSIEDFTRTVVLPQGKFSEFLKLEGKNRRDMLERLFDLRKYGDILSTKLSKEVFKKKSEEDVLKGQLKGYEDINLDVLKQSQESLKKLKDKYKIEKDNYDELVKIVNEYTEIWSLIQDINGYVEEKKILEDSKSDIDALRNTVSRAESASKLIILVNSYNQTLINLEENKEKENNLLKELSIVKKDLTQIEDKYKIIKDKYDNKLPDLKEDKINIQDAINEKILLDKLTIEIEKYKNLYNDLLKEKIEINKKIQETVLKIDKNNKDIENHLSEINEIKISTELKNDIDLGKNIEDKLESTNKLIINNKNKLEKFIKERENNIASKKDIEENLNVSIAKLNDLKSNYDKLISNCPGDNNVLLIKQQELNILKDNLNKKNKLLLEEKELLDKLKRLKNELEEFKTKNEEYLKEKEVISKESKQVEINNMVVKIKEELHKGDTCPICGGKYENDILEHKEIDKDLLKEKLDNIEVLINNINQNIIITSTKIETINNNLQSIEEELNIDEYKITDQQVKKTEEEFNKLYTDINKYNDQKLLLEKDINENSKLNAENQSKINSILKILENINYSIDNIELEQDDYLKQSEEYNDILDKLKAKYEITDFKTKYEEVKMIEIQIEKLNKQTDEIRSLNNKLLLDKEELSNKLSYTDSRISNGSAKIEEKEKFKLEKEMLIKSKVKNVNNLDKQLIDINKLINDIENEYKVVESSREKTNLQYQKINESLISIKGMETQLINKQNNEKELLDKKLLEEKFESIEDVKLNYLEPEEIEQYKLKINNYDKRLSEITGAIEGLKLKLNNRDIEEEVLNQTKEKKEIKEKEINDLYEQIIKLNQEIDNIKQKIDELKELAEKKAKLEHTLALLADLEKLFKGKKFVEFVAISRLKYISHEASKRLFDITNGNYGLEVDNDGRFKIRDFKNGGVERDASTLSGGETFLASLSLALALSNEIQLKGTAPLELFFLDEGFGTLDDNLLDVVMSSLERINSDKLKIGIISHVESIKNRVPVKLILTPAESGVGGSKVKIEIS